MPDIDSIENQQYLIDLQELERREHESAPDLERYLIRVEIYNILRG